jgi:hypothetical protein
LTEQNDSFSIVGLLSGCGLKMSGCRYGKNQNDDGYRFCGIFRDRDLRFLDTPIKACFRSIFWAFIADSGIRTMSGYKNFKELTAGITDM